MLYCPFRCGDRRAELVTALTRDRVVVLVGPRRCGKTTLARELLDEESISYFDLEDPVSLTRLDKLMTALRQSAERLVGPVEHLSIGSSLRTLRCFSPGTRTGGARCGAVRTVCDMRRVAKSIDSECTDLQDNKKDRSVITMVRTQVSLSEEEYAAAKREAERLGISLAELLRRSLRELIPADPSKPWMRYAGMVESGDPASSSNIDDVVYGTKD